MNNGWSVEGTGRRKMQNSRKAQASSNCREQNRWNALPRMGTLSCPPSPPNKAISIKTNG